MLTVQTRCVVEELNLDTGYDDNECSEGADLDSSLYCSHLGRIDLRSSLVTVCEGLSSWGLVAFMVNQLEFILQ